MANKKVIIGGVITWGLALLFLLGTMGYMKFIWPGQVARGLAEEFGVTADQVRNALSALEFPSFNWCLFRPIQLLKGYISRGKPPQEALALMIGFFVISLSYS